MSVSVCRRCYVTTKQAPSWCKGIYETISFWQHRGNFGSASQHCSERGPKEAISHWLLRLPKHDVANRWARYTLGQWYYSHVCHFYKNAIFIKGIRRWRKSGYPWQSDVLYIQRDSFCETYIPIWYFIVDSARSWFTYSWNITYL